MEGGDFFEKTRRANGTKWRADLADYWSITCLLAGHSWFIGKDEAQMEKKKEDD